MSMFEMVVVALMFAFVVAVAWICEIKKWNDGVCRETGGLWKYFDTDSQGGRGYKSGNHHCWVTYPFVDRMK